MAYTQDPRLQPVAISALRPTQMTVGLREVEEKRRAWREHPDYKKPDFLGSHLIPVIWGPKTRAYLIDHHHLARALFEEGVENVAVTTVADLSSLEPAAFWVFMDNRSWLHPYDQFGERRDPKHLPKHVSGLVDDPYRSLSGALRRAGGYAKETEPFTEFLWADFLRRRIKAKLVDGHPQKALAEALELAKSQAASFLPGWAGPTS